MTDRVVVVSTDCHAGLPIAEYKPYVDKQYHEMLDVAVPVQVEMMDKAESSFLIKEVNDAWRAPIKERLKAHGIMMSGKECWLRMELLQKLSSQME